MEEDTSTMSPSQDQVETERFPIPPPLTQPYLLDIPLELRQKIYKLCVCHEDRIRIARSGGYGEKLTALPYNSMPSSVRPTGPFTSAFALFYVNKQIYQECIPIIYGHNEFYFDAPGHFFAPESVLEEYYPEREYHRWIGDQKLPLHGFTHLKKLVIEIRHTWLTSINRSGRLSELLSAAHNSLEYFEIRLVPGRCSHIGSSVFRSASEQQTFHHQFRNMIGGVERLRLVSGLPKLKELNVSFQKDTLHFNETQNLAIALWALLGSPWMLHYDIPGSARTAAEYRTSPSPTFSLASSPASSTALGRESRQPRVIFSFRPEVKAESSTDTRNTSVVAPTTVPAHSNTTVPDAEFVVVSM